METSTIRPRNSPPAPPPKPKNKAQNGSEFHNEHITNNNLDNFHHSTQQQKVNHNNNYYLSVPPCDEQVVMSPGAKTSNSTIILIERKLVEEVSDRVHVAGGDHQGIIINKDIVKGSYAVLRFIFFFNKFTPLHRSKKCKSRSSSIVGVPCILSKCKDRAAHSGISNH